MPWWHQQLLYRMHHSSCFEKFRHPLLWSFCGGSIISIHFYHIFCWMVEATRLRTFRCWFSWALDLPSERVFYNKGIFVVAGVPRQWQWFSSSNIITLSEILVLGLQRFTVQLQGIEVSWLWPRQRGMLRLQICIHTLHNQYKQYTYYNITVQNVTQR